MHSSFAALRNELPMNCRRDPSPLLLSDTCTADIDRIQALWQHANSFSDGRGHWLFGSFGIVDAMFAPVVIRFHRYCVPLQKPAAAYVERLLQHPAMVEWVASGSSEPMVIEQEER
jgi:glutathione S-transferase